MHDPTIDNRDVVSIIYDPTNVTSIGACMLDIDQRRVARYRLTTRSLMQAIAYRDRSSLFA